MARSRRDDEPVAAPARVAGRGERPVLEELDRGRAAEAQVRAPPADDVVAAALELVDGLRIAAAHAVEVAVLVEVDAGRADRLLDAEPVPGRVDDDLHDRAAQP